MTGHDGQVALPSAAERILDMIGTPASLLEGMGTIVAGLLFCCLSADRVDGRLKESKLERHGPPVCPGFSSLVGGPLVHETFQPPGQSLEGWVGVGEDPLAVWPSSCRVK